MALMSDDTLSRSLPPGPPRLGRSRIVVWLVVAMVAFVTLLGLVAVLSVSAITRAEQDLLRARQSFRQLENSRAVEAAFNLYLLTELERRLTNTQTLNESEAAGALRGALVVYRGTIGEEIATASTDEERAEERGDMIRANTLASLFESIETEAMLDRHRAVAGQDSLDARGFLAGIAAARDDYFRKIVFDILVDERDEAARAFEQLERLRSRILSVGTGLAVLSVAAGLAFGYLFFRMLMRPIRILTQAAEALPAGGGGPPVREDLPAEFAILARRFNQMAARIGSEQQRLQGEVAARTAQLEAANAELRRIDTSRRQFFADVSHELRTPVTVLLGEAQVALRSTGDERAALERIAANGRFLRHRLDDLLKLARSEDGQLELTRAPVDLPEVLAGTVGIARAYAEANDIALRYVPGPALEVIGDAEALGQAALALVDNAIKFSSPGAQVILSGTPRGFTVADTGPGFSNTDPEVLFTRYAQEGDRGAARGAGLGLSIVKWIADQHGARLVAGNRPEGGALISLEFPG